jgi:hypothetical protein
MAVSNLIPKGRARPSGRNGTAGRRIRTNS